MNCIKLTFLLIVLSFNLFAQTNDSLLIATENIYFDFGKDDIRSSEINKLNELVEKVQGDMTGFIRLTGHTDSIGNDTDNNALSERRTNQVIQYLVEKRIAPKLRFYTGYQGEYIPVADNGSEEGRQMNRRVEIQVFEVKERRVEEVVEEIKPIPSPKEKTDSHQMEFVIKDEETDTLIQAKILYKQYISEEYKVAYTDSVGIARLDLKLKESAKIFFEFYAEGYFHDSEQIVLEKGEKFLFSTKLKPIKKGNKLALKNFYFYANQPRLLPESIPELRRLKNSLEMNSNAIVEIGGHINFPNTHPDDVDWNSKLLSERRAKVVYNYLVNNGIDETRLTYKGYSNTQMINPKATKEVDMVANRRVEVKVMGYLE